MAASTREQGRAIEIARAEERERRRIARGLHDDVGRLLTEAREELDQIEPRRQVSRADDLLRRALDATRSLTFDLGLPPVGEYGLGGVLETLCRQADARHDFDCFFEEHGQPGEISDGIVLVLSQVVRELLRNVVKHANASTVSVVLVHSDAEMQISVTDDGSGLAGAINGTGFGLADCRRRLADLGGGFEFGSKDGVGTRVGLKLPLD